MRSTPLICSSIGIATVSAITFGLAPGNCALTITDGGTTSGYSEIGITGSASNPATKMSTESTPAKIGRSMKNLERFIRCLPTAMAQPCALALHDLGGVLGIVGVRLSLAVHPHHIWRDDGAWPHALQSIHDNPLA